MISQQTKKEAEELSSNIITRFLKQFGKEVNIDPVRENRLSISGFDSEHNKVLEIDDLLIDGNVEIVHFYKRPWNPKEGAPFSLAAVIKTDSGDLIVTDGGEIVCDTFSRESEIANVCITTYPMRSSVQEKLIAVTDNVCTLFGASGVEDGGIALGFFAKDSLLNRGFVVEAVDLLKNEEDYILLDEGSALNDLFTPSDDHPLEGVVEIDGIVYFDAPAAAYTLLGEDMDGFGEDNLMPYIEAMGNAEKEYIRLISLKSTALNNGGKAHSPVVAKLLNSIQKSIGSVQQADKDLSDKKADIVEAEMIDDNEVNKPMVERDGDLENRTSKDKDQKRTRSRQRG